MEQIRLLTPLSEREEKKCTYMLIQVQLLLPVIHLLKHGIQQYNDMYKKYV
jgi:hypothetical protein